MNKNVYTLGLVSVSFRQHSSREIARAAKDAGLSCIEWGSDVHAPYGESEKISEIVGLQKEYGLFCSSYGTYFRLGETPMEEMEGYIHAAQMLGTDVLRLWCGRKSGAEMTATEKEALLAACREAAAIAEANQVTLCMECHQNTLTENPNDAVWLMESVHSSHFRMYWQPFQWQCAEENRHNAKKVAPYAKHVHVFHWKGEQKLPLEEAVEEWQNYLKEFTVPRTLLLEFMPGGTLEELQCEAAALRKITGVGL